MSQSFGREDWSPSTLATFASYITSLRITALPRVHTRSCRQCGWRRTTRRRRNCAEGHWDRWTSTECGRSTHCRVPFGTVNRRRTVSKSELDLSFANGTSKTHTQTRPRSENLHRPLVSRPHKVTYQMYSFNILNNHSFELQLVIGSKIAVNVIEQPPQRTGRFNCLYFFILVYGFLGFSTL